MIKVLFADHVGDFEAGGGEKVLNNLLWHLEPEKFILYAAIPNIQTGSLSLSLPSYIRRFEHRVRITETASPRYVKILLWLLSFPSEVIRLWRFVRQEDVDILYANSLVSGLYLTAVAKLAGKPLIYHEHNFVEQRPGRRWLAAFHWVANASEQIVAIGHAVGRSLEAHGVSKTRITVVHNGIAHDPVDKMALQELATKGRKRLGLDVSNEPIVGMVANLHRWKGHTTFLGTLGYVRSAFPDVKYVVVGRPVDIPYQAELLAFVKENNLQRNVIFTGFQEQVDELMAAMDIVVVASESEPFGLVVLEAMRLGRPVIATNVGGPSEIIRDGISGLLVNPLDPDGMAAAICDLLSCPEQRLSMGDAGRQIVGEEFTISIQVHKIASLLQNIID